MDHRRCGGPARAGAIGWYSLRLRTAALTLIVALAVAAPAIAARPPAGTKYKGKTSQGRVINLTVSKSGTGLEMKYRENFRCKGTPDRVATATYRKDRPAIAADGSYRYRKRYSGLRDRGLPSVFTNTQRLSGRFSADLSRINGRSFARVFGKEFACRSSLTFTAQRVP